jgi:type I restriction enzyme, S subunit
MSNKNKVPLVPKLRFPEFRGDDAWSICETREFLSESKNPSTQNDPSKRITVRLNLRGVEQREHRGSELIEATNYFRRKAGQFIYGKQNIHKGAFGIIPKQLHNFETSQDLPCFDFNNHCSPQWVFYHFAREDVYQPLELKMTGTGSKRLNEKTFLGLAIPAPSYIEQQKIADCLSSLDELIAAQARKVDALKTHKKGLMQQLFPRKGETQPRLRFPEFQGAREWDSRTIGDMFRLINGCAFKPEDWKPTGTPIIRIQNLNDPSAEFNYSQVPVFERNSIEPGDLLFAWSGTLGSSFGARVWNGPPGVLNQHIFKVLMDEKLITLQFSLLVLAKVEEDIARRTHGFKASFVHVKKSDLVRVELPLPTLPEQQRIASCLSSLNALISATTQDLEAIKTHKKSLMQQLFPSVEAVEA